MPYSTGLTYRDGAAQVYDSGDYPELFRRARLLVEEERWRAEQGRERGDGRRLGLGYAAYVEGTGIGPFETAAVTVEPSGRIRVETGGSSQGQGHRTTLAQLAAEALCVGVDQVDVIGGDTATLPHGFGTIASRTLVAGGMAVTEAAGRVRERLLRLAAEQLEIAPEDLELVEGRVQPRGDPAAGRSLGELASLLMPFNPGRPADEPPELRESAVYRPPTVTYAAGVHAAVVRVDARTGVVELARYAVAHDCGRVVNPMIADGQIVGGVVQGIGGALYEELIYDEEGQLRTGSLMDYLLPTAGDVPEILLDHLETPSPLNPLGVKGLGEGGAIAPPAAIANAVEDALRPLGVVIREGPLSPARVHALIRDAGPKDRTP
jgi:aerobic carbon-monoxide dehydrogenase large subunit